VKRGRGEFEMNRQGESTFVHSKERRKNKSKKGVEAKV
jgi:hypothetical protein